MTSSELLIDAFDRVRQVVHGALKDRSEQDVAFRPGSGDANSIAWLVWHLTRIQDDHLADVMGTEQVWTADGWYDRFGLPFDAGDHGYGHTSQDVGQVEVAPDLLAGYHDAVHDVTVAWLEGIEDDDLPRVVDEDWDPPVTLAVRLISVVSDDLQHAGQAAYVGGLIR